MTRRRVTSASGSVGWVPMLRLHEVESGVPVFVNGFWIVSFTLGERGTALVFVDGSAIHVEESPEAIAGAFSAR